MPPAARAGDSTNHGGTVIGPGVSTVLIDKKPAAVVGDTHQCSLDPTTHPLTVSTFLAGSATVLIGGRPAVRITDTCLCGAMPLVGAPTVMIGG